MSNKQYHMKFEICILTALVLFMLAGAIPIAQGEQIVIFRTPVFIILLTLLGLSLLVHCFTPLERKRYAKGKSIFLTGFTRKLGFRHLGFHLSHLGAILVLVGGGISCMKEAKLSFMLPVDEEFIVSEVPLKDGKIIDFGFGLALKKFNILRYKPDFALYRLNTTQDRNKQGEGYQLIRKVRISPKGVLDLGSCGKFTVKQVYKKAKVLERSLVSSRQEISPIDVIEREDGPLRCAIHLVSQTNEEIVLLEGFPQLEQHALKNGYLLKLLKPIDKQYKAVLRFITEDNSIIEQEMAMNKPVDFKGWRFYLNSYNPQAFNYIIVTARRDPGRKIAITGMILFMIGVAMIFYLGVPGKIVGDTTGGNSG